MNRLNIIITSLIWGVLTTSPVYAMDDLADEDLSEISGQAGADLAIKFTINHDANANFVCTDLVYCRLGLSLSNRYDDGSLDTYNGGDREPSTTGKKQWLVFKGIQGTINIQELKFDGEDVVYGSTTKASLKFGFTPTKPIELRNFGFNSLSIETDACAEGNNVGCSMTATAGNTPGYLTPATLYGGVGFDATKEKGFLGLNINTNLSLTGSVKMFSCSSANNHPRC